MNKLNSEIEAQNEKLGEQGPGVVRENFSSMQLEIFIAYPITGTPNVCLPINNQVILNIKKMIIFARYGLTWLKGFQRIKIIYLVVNNTFINWK